LNSRKKKRVLLATPMLDGHNRGIKLVAKGLMEAGIEVIYLGLLQTPEGIVKTAIDEDVDIIGLGTSMGIHKTVFSEVMKILKMKESRDIKVIGGGAIPERDIPFLKELGVKEIFGPGTPIRNIVDYVVNL